MRVVQNKQPHPEKATPEAAKADAGDAGEGEEDELVEVEKKQKEKLIVSGVATKVRSKVHVMVQGLNL